jgi:DNA-binding transcriptional ArsR family regulator
MPGMSKESSVNTELALLTHDLRIRIIVWLYKSGSASAAEIAENLGVSPDKVRYQLRQLVEMGAIEEADRKARRGVVERYYLAHVDRPEVFEDSDFEHLPSDARHQALAQILKLSFRSALSSLKADLLLRRGESALVHTPLLLDEQGWSELAAIHREVAKRTLKVRAESLARLGEGGEEPIPAASTVFLFELPREE